MRDIGVTRRVGASLSPGANSLILEIKALVKDMTSTSAWPHDAPALADAQSETAMGLVVRHAARAARLL
jgi:hypothetical protein